MFPKIPYDNILIIIEASIIPIIIAIKDFFLLSPSITATKEPVQAPVPGIGIPTNKIRPP